MFQFLTKKRFFPGIISGKIKKLFYCLFFLFLFFAILLFWFPSFVNQGLSCEIDPGYKSVYVFPNIIYKFANFVHYNSYIVVIFFIILWTILVILGLIQRGIPRVIAIVLIIVFFVFLNSLSSSREKARDARKQSDLRQISIALEMYYDVNNYKYPGVPGSNQWNVLEPALKEWVSPLPEDPCYRINSKWVYEYWVSSDNQEYVLKAYLQSHDSSLDNDSDGNIFGAYCGENGLREREFCYFPFK